MESRFEGFVFVRSGEPAGTRTQDPRLKRAISPNSDHMRLSATEYDVLIERLMFLPKRVRLSEIELDPGSGAKPGVEPGVKPGVKTI